MDEEENPTEDRLVAGGGKKRSSVVEGINHLNKQIISKVILYIMI